MPIYLTPLPAPLDTNQPTTIPKTVTEESSFPCRRCLQDGKPGEDMLLASYNPFPATSMSPYISPGPIFVHRACETYHCDGTVPEQQRRRLLSLRGFDRDHLLVDFAVVDGVKMMEGVEKLLGMGTVEYVLVYYAGPGCFAVRVDTAV